MKATWLMVLFAGVFLSALAWAPGFDPASDRCVRPGRRCTAAPPAPGRSRAAVPARRGPAAQPPSGARCGRCTGRAAPRSRGAGDPGPAGRRHATADRSLFVEEFLQGSGELAGQALLPLQHVHTALRHVERGAYRSETARICLVGQLRHGLEARADPQPVSRTRRRRNTTRRCSRRPRRRADRRSTRRRRCPTGMATTGATVRRITAPSGSGAWRRRRRSSRSSRPSIRSGWCRASITKR